jgi:GR25 family glycosyltransferase involved in LPS biosynthesis
MAPAELSVDEIVCITLRDSVDRQEHIKKQFPPGVPWRFHVAERDPEGGKAGCYRSHATVLEDARRRGLQRVLVLEDDATFVFDWDETVSRCNAALAALPQTDKDWAFLLTGLHPTGNVEKTDNIIRRVTCASGTHGYVANIERIELPLPEYNGRHVDTVLFCDYYCLSSRPLDLDADTLGVNSSLLSVMSHRVCEPCSSWSKHLFAVNPLLMKVDSSFDSSVSELHHVAMVAADVVGHENVMATLGAVGGDVATIAAQIAAFCVAVLIGRAIGLRWPMRSPNVLAGAAIMIFALVISVPAPGAKDACSYPCTRMWSMSIVVVAAWCALSCLVVAYSLASMSMPAMSYMALLLAVTGVYGLAATILTPPLIHNAMIILASIGIGWLASFFMGQTQTAVFLALVMFLGIQGNVFKADYILARTASEEQHRAARCREAAMALRTFLLISTTTSACVVLGSKNRRGVTLVLLAALVAAPLIHLGLRA